MKYETRTNGLVKELREALISEPLIQKYLKNGTWTSGSSTTVYPITFWKNEVELQLSTNKNIFTKFIKRFVEQHADLVVSGAFSKWDGSCPSTLTFWYNIPDNNWIKKTA